MRTFPEMLRAAEDNVIIPNMTKGASRAEGGDVTHTEHAKLWCAMRYHYGHWTSTKSLESLLAVISTENCRYDVPLFLQYTAKEIKFESTGK